MTTKRRLNSFSVLSIPFAPEPFIPFIALTKVDIIRGRVFTRLMKPPAVTIPAPIYLIYILQIADAPFCS